jgi:D-serine deaminase-like pyridoxal phosphate-dependent protein
VLIAELDTPAVLIDLDIAERNMLRLASYCREKNLRLRPHTKTHKIPELAHKQLELGACGITVAKSSEARVMVDAGIQDVLVAYPIVTDLKAKELAHLADRAKITVSLDSNEAATALSRQASAHGVHIDVMVEIDVGFRRCGVANEEQALSLARRIMDLPGLEFQGLMFYPGHMLAEESERRRLLTAVNECLDRIQQALQQAGCTINCISGGSTPTAFMSHEFHGVTEIRPGMYAFNDRNMLTIKTCDLSECAVSVVVTVVSTAVPGRAIVDGGSKTFSSDGLLAGSREGYGLLLDDQDTKFASVSEEHGHLNISNSSRTYKVGDRLSILPNHVCATINMHDQVYATRNDKVQSVWRVAGRGKLQ